jgi:hypothetical protein
MQTPKEVVPETRSNGSRQKEVVNVGSGEEQTDRFFN